MTNLQQIDAINSSKDLLVNYIIDGLYRDFSSNQLTLFPIEIIEHFKDVHLFVNDPQKGNVSVIEKVGDEYHIYETKDENENEADFQIKLAKTLGYIITGIIDQYYELYSLKDEKLEEIVDLFAMKLLLSDKLIANELETVCVSPEYLSEQFGYELDFCTKRLRHYQKDLQQKLENIKLL